MSRTHKVTLEILRHGPPHNQLLSPLTDYLALCGNHGSATVRVPFEHSHFLARHRFLTYGEGGPECENERRHREMELKITAQEISGILAGVPGLIAELSSPRCGGEITHFEIVLSAAELALLPFELAEAPEGFPGAGQPLTLQAEAPLCLTRRVRRIENDCFQWPTSPRILFAIASPPGFLVPARSHLAALRKILQPWIRRKVDQGPPPSRRRELEPFLKVIPQASARQISAEIKNGRYTHVHILAHGVEYEEGYDRRFGLALHDDRDPGRSDRVSASRLAAAIRPYQGLDSRLAEPAVVTIASCYGAGQGSVVGAGSSVAHALHEAGVPLVVSSQFPLSFAGSVLMVEGLYDGLLWGADPRVLINELRRQLKSQMCKTHDWASLVAYAALPADIDRQLAELCYWQARKAIEAAFYYVESHEIWTERDTADSEQARNAVYRQVLDRLAHAKVKLGELVVHDEAHRTEQGRPLLKPEFSAWVRGLLASTAKREAEVHHLLGDSGHEWSRALRQARDWYGKAFEADRTQAWALAQQVALASLLAVRLRRDPKSWKGTMRDRWQAAYGLLRRDLEQADHQLQIWAHSNLIELHMIWPLICPQSEDSHGDCFWQELERVEASVMSHLTELLSLVSADDSEIRSRRRQSQRYINFFLPRTEPVFSKEAAKDVDPDLVPRGVVVRLSFTVLDRLSEFH